MSIVLFKDGEWFSQSALAVIVVEVFVVFVSEGLPDVTLRFGGEPDIAVLRKVDLNSKTLSHVTSTEPSPVYRVLIMNVSSKTIGSTKKHTFSFVTVEVSLLQSRNRNLNISK